MVSTITPGGLAVMQSFVLIFYVPFWFMWTGRRKSWLNNRGGGWHPLMWLGMGFWFQGAIIGVLLGEVLLFLFDSAAAQKGAFVGLAVIVLGLYLTFSGGRVPRSVLPAWIKERLAAGDPVRTADPLPEVQHLMTLPQNRPDTSWHPTREQMSPPTRLPVNMWRWGATAFIGLATGLYLTSIVLNPWLGIHSLDDSGAVTVLTFITPLAAVLTLAAGTYYLYGFVRPQHVTVTEGGVSTPAWSVAWEDILGVTKSRAHIVLDVTAEAARKHQRANRWHSGAPFSVGGLIRDDNGLALQMGMKNEKQAFTLLQHLHYLKTGRLTYPDQPRSIPINDD
ncbi:hypothetical protein BJH93_00180 [Kocuria polaris]|nr:hypothetical protein [Kocuria polaris]